MDGLPELLSLSGALLQGDILILIGFMKTLVNAVDKVLTLILSSLEADDATTITLSFLIYEYFVFKFHAYIIPLVLLVCIGFRVITDFDDGRSHEIQSTRQSQGLIGSVNPVAMNLQHLTELVDSLQDIVPTVANIQFQMARILKLFNITVISLKTCKILFLITAKMYALGLRYSLMLGGIVVMLRVHPSAQAFLQMDVVQTAIRLAQVRFEKLLGMIFGITGIDAYIGAGTVTLAMTSVLGMESPSEGSQAIQSEAIIPGIGIMKDLLDSGSNALTSNPAEAINLVSEVPVPLGTTLVSNVLASPPVLSSTLYSDSKEEDANSAIPSSEKGKQIAKRQVKQTLERSVIKTNASKTSLPSSKESTEPFSSNLGTSVGIFQENLPTVPTIRQRTKPSLT